MRGTTAALLLVAGCSPATSRPAFAPLPQAAVVLLAAEPTQVSVEADAWLRSRGVPIRSTNPRDCYVETRWYVPPADSTAAARAVAAGTANAVLTRVWADPAGPGRTRLTVETVYRVVEDPSRPPRDLERLTRPGSPGNQVSGGLLAALKQHFEVL